MIDDAMTANANDDPRKLRTLLSRASNLAHEHDVSSVVVGLVSPVGEVGFPEFVEFLRAALRVEDAIFRMTRERVVIHLADVDAAAARDVIERLLGQFRSEFPTARDLEFGVSEMEIHPGGGEISVRDVLVQLFSPDAEPVLH